MIAPTPHARNRRVKMLWNLWPYYHQYGMLEKTLTFLENMKLYIFVFSCPKCITFRQIEKIQLINDAYWKT